jgi:hypothetical protein
VIPARLGTDWMNRCYSRAGRPSIAAMYCVTALRTTVAIIIFIDAPGTVLRLSGLFDADDSRENSQDE